jgi:penicillin V acylase-like amidase (Ntn superfamily)
MPAMVAAAPRAICPPRAMRYIVRAVAFSANARTPDTVAEGVNATLHLLSSFAIAKGVVRDAAPEGVTGAAGAGLGNYTC